MTRSSDPRPGSSGPAEGADLLRQPAELRRLLQSPETRRLIDLLRQRGNLDAAARAAKGGDPAALKGMLSGLQESPEGAAALEQLERQLKR